jgi:predicted permease
MRPRGVKKLFGFSFRTSQDVRDEIDAEFQFHLDMRQDELVRLGMSEAEARAQARREFGDAASGAAGCTRSGHEVERRRRLRQLAGEVRQDAALGFRLLRRSPGFTLVAILTLALGIGANTAMFSALDTVVLRPLPYPDSDRLLHVSEAREDGGPNSVSGGAYLDWRQRQTEFSAMVLLGRVSCNLRGRGLPERLNGVEATHEFLDVLGIAPLLGRGFLPGEDRPGNDRVVILTEELWRTRFGGDPSILNSTLVLDEVPRTVIGILPRGTWLFTDDSFFIPAVLAPGTPRAMRAPHWAVVFGRLKPGVSPAAAEAELKNIKKQLTADYPTFKRDWSVTTSPLPELVAGPNRPSLLILFGAVSLVLLIACANVANLLLARTCNREQEIAVRSALGATRWRIVRQVLTESLMLAIIGGAAALAVAFSSLGLLKQLIGDIIPQAAVLTLDGRVLAFAGLVTAAAGLLFGILPALGAGGATLNDTLKNGGKSATAGGHRRSQSMLVVLEVALTVVLLTCAGLLMRSLANTSIVDPGFEPSKALALDLSLPDATYTSPDRRVAFSKELLGRIRSLPGVEMAGAGIAVPFSGRGYGEYFLRPDRGQERNVTLGRVDYVSPGYLEALGAHLRVGRTIAEGDDNANGPRVAVVTETTARIFFPDGNALDNTLTIAGQTWRIVGIVGDIADRRLDAAHGPFAYLPRGEAPNSFSMVVRASVPPLGLVNSIRREVERLDPGVAVANPRALDAAMATSMNGRRTILTIVGTFAAGALLLACIGLYGVMAYSVATRRREICIRVALGAVRRDVIAHVVGGGLRLTLVGLVLGLAAASAAARLLSAELFRVHSYDPLVMVATVLAIVLVAVFACWLPARRATSFDPIAALRDA